MQNNVGIYASQISGHLYSGPYGSYDSLATVTLSASGTSSITFAGIPSGYKHLQIRVMARNEWTINARNEMRLEFNGDTSANYSWHGLDGDGSAASAQGNTGASSIGTGVLAGDQLTSGIYSTSIIDILDYGDTNKYKTTRALTGIDGNGSGWLWWRSGNWRSTSAISTIKLFPGNTQTFKQYSQFALYGVK